MAKGIFITATGTDAGKTYVTALLIKKLRAAGYDAGYYKAALSGADRRDGRLIPGDADYVKRAAGIKDSFSEMVSYIYEKAVSPHLAAEIEGIPVEMKKIMGDYQKASKNHAYLTVEGSGGLICPLRREGKCDEPLMLADIIKAMGLGILIVAPAQLGTINSTMLTVEYARSQGIPVKGIILNFFHQGDRMEEDNCRFLEEFSGVPIVARLGENAKTIEIDLAFLAGLYEGEKE